GGRVTGSELLRALSAGGRGERRFPAPADLHERAVAAPTRGAPDPDLRTGSEHVVWHLERHAEDVLGGERVVAGELKVVERAFAVGEEWITADPDEEPTRASLDRLPHVVKVDGRALSEHLTASLRLPTLAA